MSQDPDPDIVEIILQACRAGGLDADVAHAIEHTVRTEYGGLRVRIPKRRKHMTPEQRQQVFQAGLGNESTEKITEKYKIGRATLFRLMKKGE